MQIFRASSHSSLNQRLKKNGEKGNAERPNFAGDLTQTSWIIDIVRGMLCDQNSFYGVGLVRSHPLRKGKASPHNVDLIFSLNWKWTLFMLARKTKKRNGTRLPTKSSHSLNDYASYCLENFIEKFHLSVYHSEIHPLIYRTSVTPWTARKHFAVLSTFALVATRQSLHSSSRHLPAK